MGLGFRADTDAEAVIARPNVDGSIVDFDWIVGFGLMHILT